jgi:hypothetical protein
MSHDDYSELMQLVEEIRGLSFCLDASGERVRAETERLEEIVSSLKQASGLKTVFDAKARELSGKIAQLKTLMDL